MISRKLVLGTLSAIAALSLSANVFADCGGDECGECGGYGQIDNCGAYYPPGAYIGLSAGYAGVWWKDLGGITQLGSAFDVNAGNGALGGRASIGYDFSAYFQAEMGYLYIYKQNISVSDPNRNVFFNPSLRTYALDIVGKLKLPLDNGFYLFTLLGADYYKTKRAPQFEGFNVPPSIDNSRSAFGVSFGAGGGYAFTPNTHFEITWQHYQGDGKIDNHYLPDIDYFSLGFTYKFLC